MFLYLKIWHSVIRFQSQKNIFYVEKWKESAHYYIMYVSSSIYNGFFHKVNRFLAFILQNVAEMWYIRKRRIYLSIHKTIKSFVE